jgi:hypothetical protein
MGFMELINQNELNGRETYYGAQEYLTSVGWDMHELYGWVAGANMVIKSMEEITIDDKIYIADKMTKIYANKDISKEEADSQIRKLMYGFLLVDIDKMDKELDKIKPKDD